MQSFNMTFIPNSKTPRQPQKIAVQARGTRDALSKSGRLLDLARTRIITDPRGKHTATAYDADGNIVGMVQVRHAPAGKAAR